jgi:hypothetical protein
LIGDLQIFEEEENKFSKNEEPPKKERTMGVTNLSEVKNKVKRQQKFRSNKVDKAKAKLAERKQRAQAEKLDPKLKEVQPAPYRL